MPEGIHIKKKNRGKFTATKKRTGKSTEELTHSKNPLTRKRAIFAQNVRRWNHKKSKNESYMRTNLIRLTEGDLRRLVAEATMRILREARDPMNNINALIDQANEAYQRIVDEFGPGLHLMDREGNSYGLKGNIRLDGRGYVIIPLDDPYGSYAPEKIRVLTKSGGKLRIIKGDYMEQGWNDAKKILKSIIRDAERGYGHLQDYDPNWEDKDSYPDGKQRIEDFNKTHGFKRGANMNESHLYTDDINPDDLQVSGHWTDDGYAVWEATVDNGWYTFRGTYDGFDCELDEIIEGHSGHAVQHDIDDEAIDWFNDNIADKVGIWLNNHAESFEEYHARNDEF